MIYEVVLLTTPSLLKPEKTAQWEQGLEGIINGSVEFADYRSELEEYIRTETQNMIDSDLTQKIAMNINQFTGKESKGIATRKPLGIKCPACGGELTTTSFGYGCSNYSNEEIKCKFSLGQIAGVDVSEEQFIKLIQEGKTDLIEGFKSKANKPFKSVLKLEKGETGEYNVVFDFSETPTEYVEGLSCPVCGGRIAQTGYGFACEHRFQQEDQCYFSVGEIAGRKLSCDELTTLLQTGYTDVLSGFKSKTNQKFSARIRLKEGEDGRKILAFDFDGIEREKLEGARCPDCGGDLVKTSFGYGCSNYNKDEPEKGCRFNIGKIAGKQLSKNDLIKLLSDGKTDTVRGFKGKSGKKFDAVLVLRKNDEGKSEIAFDFDNVEAKEVKDVVCPMCGGKIIVTSFGYGCSNYNRDDPDNSCRFNIGQIAGVKLKEAQVKELLSNGVTSLISGFKSKKGTKFDAKLSLGRDDEGKVTGIKFVFEDNEKEIPKLKCPKCGEPIIKTHYGYRCKNNIRDNVDSCPFFVGKIAGVDIDEEQFTKLINEKRTDVITGFLSKKGLYFDARIKLDENCKTVFEFENYS